MLYICLFHLKFIMFSLKAPLHNVEIYTEVKYVMWQLCGCHLICVHCVYELHNEYISHEGSGRTTSTLCDKIIEICWLNICLPVWAFILTSSFLRPLRLTSVCLLVSFAQHVFCCYFANSCNSLICVMEVWVQLKGTRDEKK